MPWFYATYEKTLAWNVTVEAESQDEAEDMIYEMDLLYEDADYSHDGITYLEEVKKHVE